MDSIDISDLAFSLSNLSAVNEVISDVVSSTTEKISDTIPEFIPENIINEEVIKNNFVPETLDVELDENFYMYLGIGVVVIVIIGFFVYNYYISKNKQVRFQNNVEYYNDQPMYNRSEF